MQFFGPLCSSRALLLTHDLFVCDSSASSTETNLSYIVSRNRDVDNSEYSVIGLLSEELLECVYDDKLVRTKLLTKRLTPEERTVASRTVEAGRSLLFVAIEEVGRLFKDFIFDECQTDTEQRDDGDMTPMMWAALSSGSILKQEFIRR